MCCLSRYIQKHLLRCAQCCLPFAQTETEEEAKAHTYIRKENRPEFPNSSMTQKKRKSFVNRMNERSAKVVVQRLGPRLLLFFAAVNSIGSTVE